MKRIVFSAMAVAAVTAPAAAQEATKFDGPFVGVQLGWQQDRRSATSSTVPPSTTRVTGDGLVYGGQVGYDVNNVTARAGLLVSPESLLYARGGYSNARFSFSNPAGNSESRNGYTLGAGYERSLTDKISARIEYAYSNYGSDTLPGIGGPVDINYRRHGITAGFNLRF